MANAKVTALTQATSIAGSDVLYIVTTPGGTPASKKATLASLLTGSSSTTLTDNAVVCGVTGGLLKDTPLTVVTDTAGVKIMGIGVGSVTNNAYLDLSANSVRIRGYADNAGLGVQTYSATAGDYVERMKIAATGIFGFSSYDNTGTPVASTAHLNMFAYNKSVADDGIVTLYAITNNAFGFVNAGASEEFSMFRVDATGTVTLISNSTNVVANADTDAKICVGTAATQEPLQIKNRLGATKVLNILVFYA